VEVSGQVCGLEFAESLPAGEVSAPVARLTDLYLVARFGNHGASSAAATDDRWKIPLADRNADAQRFVALLATVQAARRARPASRG
jgi:hypothetical protein